MKREYAAYECQHFLAEIDKMININSSRLKRKEKNRQLEEEARKIISKNENLTKKKIPPVAVFFQLKNQKGGEEKLREAWMKNGGQSHAYEVLEKLKLNEPRVNIKQLPKFSWLLSIEFTLLSPYTSQDDNPFYMLDNPLRREWVFKVPYISPSQWKGMLRASLSYHLVEKAGELQPEEFAKQRFLLTTLFGDEKGEGEGNGSNLVGFLDKACTKAIKPYNKMLGNWFNLKPEQEPHSSKGNLYFYPTYFNIDKTGFEIINPHSRTTGSGTVPFYLETVPVGTPAGTTAETKGKMAVLYVPLYVKPGSDQVGNAVESFKLVTHGLYDLFMYHGLGAKKSSGFGVVKTEEKIDGNFINNSPNASKEISGNSEQTEKFPMQYQPFFDENGQVKAVFLKPDGTLHSNKEYKSVSDETEISLNKYKLFRYWYQQHGEIEKTSDEQVAESGYSFSSFKEMLELPLKLLQWEGE